MKTKNFTKREHVKAIVDQLKEIQSELDFMFSVMEYPLGPEILMVYMKDLTPEIKKLKTLVEKSPRGE